MSKIQDERQVDDELELLHLQERMKISQSRPSASVTRITRQPSTNKPSNHDVPPPPSPDTHHHHDNHPPPQDSLAGVFLGDVVERSPTTSKPITARIKPSTASAPFPEAVHRKASKFALGRQRKTISVALAATNTTTTTTTASSTHNIPQKAEDNLASSIDEENRQALEAMSQEEIVQAQLELLSKLDPKTIHFLKHTRKQQQQQQQLAVEASAISKPLPPAPVINNKETYPCLASPPPPVASTLQQQGGGGVKKSLASRVRYDIDGHIVGLAADTEPSASTSNGTNQSVVRRDVLRSDEGILPIGYTIGEASLLARSTVPQQRVLALRLLKAVVLRSHPAGHYISNDSNSSTTLCECGDDEGIVEKHLNNKLKWEDVWHHALHEESLVTRLRVAFDDNNLNVVSSAAEALAALFTPYTSTTSNDSIDCLPWGLGGWPGVPLRHLQRPHAAAPWVAVPLDIHLQHINEEKEEGGEKEEELDERQVGKVDPLGGLLNMNILSRIVYVYLTLQAPGSIDAIIELLLACAMAGREVCRAVIDTAGMKEVLLHLLSGNNREKKEEEEEEEEEEREGGNRGERCLRMVRLLAQSSPRNCISLFFSDDDDDDDGSDLRRIVLDALLLTHHHHSNMSGERHTERIEALRLWRVMAAYNRHLITMDDAFGPLATLFTTTTTATTTHGEVVREVYLTAGALCHAGVMMSPHCAESILTMAVQSLEQQVVDVVGTDGGDQKDDDDINTTVVRYESIAAVLGYIEMYCSKNRQAIPSVVARLDTTCLLGSFADGIETALNGNSSNSNSITSISSRSRNALVCIAMSLCVLQVMSGKATTIPSLSSSMHHLLDTIIINQALPCCHTLINSMDATLLQPWDLVVINSHLPLIRLALHSAWLTITVATITNNCHKQGGEGDTQELERVKLAITMAATALVTLPPGDEQSGLHALSILTHPTAIKYLDGVINSVYCSDDITSLATPFDAHKEQEVKKTKDDDAAETMSKTLMTGWAATWLGMVQEEEKHTTTTKTSIPVVDASKEYCNLMLTRLPVPLTLSPQGSSLPLSPDWPVREVPWVPADASSSSSTAAAAGYALYFTLAMMHHDHTVFSLKQKGMDYNVAVVKSAVQLVFDCRPGESSSSSSNSSTTIVGGGGGGITSGLWTDGLVRWSLYKILQYHSKYHPKYLKEQQERKDEWTLPEAQSLVSQYASTSYGDGLFGASVALLLRRHVPATVQLEVLVMLAESRALHLLPSLQSCCSISRYNPSSSSKLAAAVFLDPPRAQDEREEGETVAYYLKLVEDGTLALCWDRQSIAADILIHRLALKMYTGGGDGDGEVSAKRKAMVCAVLRRACQEEEEEEEGGGGGNRVVSALVRWDTNEMVASDVVTEERLEYIKEACESQGEVALWKEVVKWSREA